MEVLPIPHHEYQQHNRKSYSIFCPIVPVFNRLSLLAGLVLNHTSKLDEPTYGSTEFLSKKLEEEIRAAKRTHLSCGEVLLPCGLLQKIADDILDMSELELCGLRGMTLYLLFEGEEDCRRLSAVKIDPTTPSTFELYLTFKQANAGWTFLPQFLK